MLSVVRPQVNVLRKSPLTLNIDSHLNDQICISENSQVIDRSEHTTETKGERPLPVQEDTFAPTSGRDAAGQSQRQEKRVEMSTTQTSIKQAADKLLVGRIDALNQDNDSSLDDCEIGTKSILGKRLLGDFKLSKDLYSKYSLQHAQLAHGFMARGANVPETCDVRTSEDTGVDFPSTDDRKLTFKLLADGDSGMRPGSEEYVGVKKARQKYRPSRPPLLPPCRVCGDRASGFHYGVNTCEACKGFFRRSILKAQPYICTGNGDCKTTAGKRTVCSHCRFKRCIEVGMSKNAIKTGRYTHELRSKNILEVKSLEKQKSDEEMVTMEIQNQPNCDEVKYVEYQTKLERSRLCEEQLNTLMTGQTYLYENLDEYYDETLMYRRQVAVYDRYMTRSRDVEHKPGGRINGVRNNSLCNWTAQPDILVNRLSSAASDHNRNAATGSKNNEDRSEVNCSNPFGDLNGCSVNTGTKLTINNEFVTSSDKTRAAVMSDILKDIEQGINGLLTFSNYVPGFVSLDKNDKEALIKSSRFDVWYLGHIRCFNADLRVGACDWQFHADELAEVWGQDLIDLSFKMTRHGQALDLSKEETAVLRAICLTMPDRCGTLENRHEVENMNAQMWDMFRFVTEKRQLNFHTRLPKVINLILLLREFGIKFESISSQLMLDWSVVKENPLLLSVFLT